MASYHCSVKVGGKGKAGPHAEYIARIGKYSGSARFEDCEYTEHGNMPGWALGSPEYFWAAADEYERANGATYREIMVALPRELTPEQRIELVRDLVLQEIGLSHPYSLAIHNPAAAIEGGEQPHVHIMYSERTMDGIERDPNEFFKRYNAKNPEKGGCKKDSAGTPERLATTRERWANIQNEHLARHGHDVEVDHRSYADQGIDRQPEKHLGSKGIRRLKDEDISALLELRVAQGEKERADQEVKSLIIDLSGDIGAAKQYQEREIDLRMERHWQRQLELGRERDAAVEAQHKLEEESQAKALEEQTRQVEQQRAAAAEAQRERQQRLEEERQARALEKQQRQAAKEQREHERHQRHLQLIAEDKGEVAAAPHQVSMPEAPTIVISLEETLDDFITLQQATATNSGRREEWRKPREDERVSGPILSTKNINGKQYAVVSGGPNRDRSAQMMILVHDEQAHVLLLQKQSYRGRCVTGEMVRDSSMSPERSIVRGR